MPPKVQTQFLVASRRLIPHAPLAPREQYRKLESLCKYSSIFGVRCLSTTLSVRKTLWRIPRPLQPPPLMSPCSAQLFGHFSLSLRTGALQILLFSSFLSITIIINNATPLIHRVNVSFEFGVDCCSGRPLASPLAKQVVHANRPLIDLQRQ